MADIFKTLLLISCIGSVVGLFLIVSRPFTRKIFSSSWHYYMWLVVLLIMVLPIKINMPIKHAEESSPVVYEQRQSISEQEFVSKVENVNHQDVPESPDIENKAEVFTRDNFTILSYIWLIGFLTVLFARTVSYLVFCLKVRSKSQIISCPEIKAYTSRKIITRVSDDICSPLMVGILKPVLVLPKTIVTEEQLHYILKHEITHLKRQDILYKWFLSFVKSIHWFNPVIYIVSRYINLDCEISCDMAVVKNLDETETKGYVETILTLLSSKNKRQIPLTTGMTGNKNSLKKRFLSIKNKNKVSLGMKALSLIIAVVIIIGAVFISGIINGQINLKDNDLPEVVNNIQTDNDDSQQTDAIEEAKESDNIIDSTEKSEQNATVKTKKENNGSPIKEMAKADEDAFKIKSTEVAERPYSGFNKLEIDGITSEKIQEELKDRGINKASEGSADLNNSYIAGDYSYKDGLDYNNNVVCDENGNISVYFDIKTDNIVDVNFYEAETKKDVGGYKILANSDSAYTFMGFDPEKTYIVDVQGETGSSWKIEGEYIIY